MSARKRPASESVEYVPRLDNVVVNVRDAGGRGNTVREFLLVFPAVTTNTPVKEVMRMIEHQLKQKLRRLQLGGANEETRLVLAGAGMTIVQHLGGSFQEAGEGQQALYVPEDDSVRLTTHRGAAYDGEALHTALSDEPVQWKTWGGTTGVYNLLDGSFVDECELLNHANKGLEAKDVRAMAGFKYALLEAQVYLDERLWVAFDAAPRADNKALKVAVRAIGDGESSGVLASPVDMTVRVLSQGVSDALKPHTAKVLEDIERVVEAAGEEMGEAPDEEALRLLLITKLSTLKRTVHFKAYHPDRASRSGLGVEDATTMAAWLEQLYSYMLKRRLKQGGDAEGEGAVFERA